MAEREGSSTARESAMGVAVDELIKRSSETSDGWRLTRPRSNNVQGLIDHHQAKRQNTTQPNPQLRRPPAHAALANRPLNGLLAMLL